MKIRGGQLLAKALQEKGVDQVFTLSGGFKQFDDVSIAAALTMFSSYAENDVYMGLADVHRYHPSQAAIEQSDVVIMVGVRLDNPMNFSNPPSNLPMEEQ